MALLQYYLDLRLAEFLPNMDTHTSGVVTLMLRYVLVPNAFLLRESSHADVLWLMRTGKSLRSLGLGKHDLFYFGSCLFSALKSVCVDFYDAKVDQSWRRFYSFLLRYMLTFEERQEGGECLLGETLRSLSAAHPNPASDSNSMNARGTQDGVQRLYTRKENCIVLDQPSL